MNKIFLTNISLEVFMSKSKTTKNAQGGQRINFSSAQVKAEVPDFLEIQMDSFQKIEKKRGFTRHFRKTFRLQILEISLF